MLLHVRFMETDSPITCVRADTGRRIGVRDGRRIHLTNPKTNQSVIAINYFENAALAEDAIYVSRTFEKTLGISKNDLIEVTLPQNPTSYTYIRKKIAGDALTSHEISSIVSDAANQVFTPPELTAFITALEINGMNMDETEYLARAMAASGESISFTRKPVIDHHSIGGVPGNKVTLLVVPIIAAAGLLIPKTCSRAITGAAGTGDLMEALSPVAFTAEQIKEMTQKAGGVIVWGGSTNLVPVDNMFIDYEYQVGVNPRPMMLASIMSKKKVVNPDICVLDIPIGKDCKVKTIDEGRLLSNDLIELGKRLGIEVQCALTFGGAPVGRTIGVNLEVAEALSILENCKGDGSLYHKSCVLAGMALEMAGKAVKGQGEAMAAGIIHDGRAYAKMLDIIRVQGGNPDIKAADLKPGEFCFKVRSAADGRVVDMHNRALIEIARLAGCPTDHGAGMYLDKKPGEPVSAGDILFTIYADNENKLRQAVEKARILQPVSVSGVVLGYVA